MASYSFYNLEPPDSGNTSKINEEPITNEGNNSEAIPNKNPLDVDNSPKKTHKKLGIKKEAPNNFRFDSFLPVKKTEKTEISIANLQKTLCNFSIDAQPINESPRKEKYEYIHSKSYEVLNGDRKRYTQQQNIKEKLETFMQKFKDEQEKGEKPAMEVLKNGEKLKEASEDEEIMGNSKENRYFNLNPQFFCFRCKKAGHFQKTCPDEDETRDRCLICLDEGHHVSKCDSYICFRCLKSGHMARDCKSSQFGSCYRCQKRGHKAKDCGVLLENTKETEPEKGIRCLKCQKKGHINCREIEKKDKVYRGEDFSSRKKKKESSGRKKRWEDENIKSNLEYFEEWRDKDEDGLRKKKIKKGKSKGKNKKQKRKK